MAYLLTAVMTGGVAAILSLVAGDSFGQILLNYVLYGYLGMAVLMAATFASGTFRADANSKGA
jgi:hypothetical protein